MSMKVSPGSPREVMSQDISTAEVGQIASFLMLAELYAKDATSENHKRLNSLLSTVPGSYKKIEEVAKAVQAIRDWTTTKKFNPNLFNQITFARKSVNAILDK